MASEAELDQDDIDYAQGKYKDASDRLRENVELMSKFKSEYEELDSVLANLSDTLKPKIMVPIGSLAFMPGHISNTNEIMVFLGENYYAKRSVKQAREILERRIQGVDSEIDRFKKQLENFELHARLAQETRSGSVGNFHVNSDGTIEILEFEKSEKTENVPPKKESASISAPHELPNATSRATEGGDVLSEKKNEAYGHSEEHGDDERRRLLQAIHMSEFLEEASDSSESFSGSSDDSSDEETQPIVRSPADIYKMGMALKSKAETNESAASARPAIHVTPKTTDTMLMETTAFGRVVERDEGLSTNIGSSGGPQKESWSKEIPETGGEKPISRFKQEMQAKKSSK